MTGIPSISALPPAPSRSDDSTTFSSKANAFVAALVVMVAELNAALAAVPEIAQAVNYNTTSNTSVTVGTGQKDFSTPPNGLLQLGQWVIAASSSDPTNYMAGQVVAHDSTSGQMTIDVASTGGAGAHSDWVIAPTPSGDIGNLAAVATSGDGADLLDSTVSFSKVQSVSSSSLVGRYSASVGPLQSITLGAGLSLSGAGVLSVSGGTLTLADGDYGDVVISGSGTAIAIDSNAVTYSKIQQMAANTILGNPTGGTANAQAITCTAAGRALLDDADAATQRTTLGLGSIATMAEMTAADYWSNTADKAMTTDSVWSACAYQPLTQAATIAVNFGAGINFTTTMTGDRQLGNPSGAKTGQTGIIEIKQDASGNRLLTYASAWVWSGGTVPVLSTAANARDLLTYTVLPDGKIFGSMAKDVK